MKRRDYENPLPSSDCRCGNCEKCPLGNCILRPWIAVSSADNWGDDCLTPDGLPDGDVRDPLRDYVPIEELAMAGMDGSPLYGFDGSELYAEDDSEDLEEAVYEMLHSEGTVEEDEEVPTVAYPEPSPEPFFRHEEEKVEMVVGQTRFVGHHPLEILPSREPASHVIASGRAIESRRVIRRSYDNNGSHSHGKRGDDRYKDRRIRAQQRYVAL